MSLVYPSFILKYKESLYHWLHMTPEFIIMKM